MKFSLRTLLAVAFIGPPLLAGAYILFRELRTTGLPIEPLLVGLFGSGIIFFASIWDYRRQPTPTHLVIAAFALLVFVSFLALCGGHKILHP